jgi:hypothetical protein
MKTLTLKDIEWGMYNGKDYVHVSFPHVPTKATIEVEYIDEDLIREALEDLVDMAYYPLTWGYADVHPRMKIERFK